MRAVGLLVLALASSCTIAEDQDIVLECFAPDPGLYVGQTVGLNAQIADRPPGQFPEEYTWALTSVPEGGAVRLDRADERDPTFVPVVPGAYTAEVNVVDFDGTPAGPCEVTYEVAPEPIPCGDGTNSTDYEAGECPPDPLLLVVSGTFAYDAGRESAVAFTSAGGAPVPVTVSVEVLDGAFNTLCTAEFTSDNEVPQGDWANSLPADGWFGFTVPADAGFESDCGAANLDPVIVGEDADAWLQGLDLGLALTVMDDELATALEDFIIGNLGQAAWDNDYVPFVIGGAAHIGAWSDRRDGGLWNVNFTFGYEQDAQGAVQFDDANENGVFDEDDEERNTLPAVSASDSLAGGMYEILGGFVIDARCGWDPLLCQ